MVSSSAATVDEYLAELPADRAALVSAVRDLVNEHLPDGYEEGMAWGMITWTVPLSVYPDTYNKQPLAYAGLAAQKQYTSLYLMPLYNGGPIDEGSFRARWQAPRKPNLGKSCLRFTRLEDIDVPLVAEVIASVPRDAFVARAKAVHGKG